MDNRDLFIITCIHCLLGSIILCLRLVTQRGMLFITRLILHPQLIGNLVPIIGLILAKLIVDKVIGYALFVDNELASN